MVKDADNIYYCTKNQVRGLCVGGDMAILLWNEQQLYGSNRADPFLDGMSVYGKLSVYHRTKHQVRRRKFHLKNVTNIWKKTVYNRPYKIKKRFKI